MSPQDLLKAYEAEINRHQFDSLAPLISDDAVVWFSNGSHKGKAEIRRAFERTWKTLNNDTYWLEDVDWIAISARDASCIYRFNWETEISGKTVTGGGRGTTVLCKESTGWKIVHEHLSLEPAAKP